MTGVPQIFSRKKLAAHRTRAGQIFHEHDFLMDLAAERLVDRLLDFNQRFGRILIIGAQGHLIKKHLSKLGYTPEIVLEMDIFAADSDAIIDPEALPIKPQSFDAVLSHFILPFVNDVPGALIQWRQALVPDGVLLATTLGAQTLEGFRDLLIQAELEVYGGVSQRIGPFMEMQDLAGLLQRGGFSLPVIDQDIIRVEYRHLDRLISDLRGMGWTSCLTEGGRVFTKALHKKINWKQSLEAAFEVLNITARAPSIHQQKPAQRGSGETSLANHLKDDNV
tara:strand:+ start:478 stop:1314 length:837 start_codon:yes stop_codon:yes gene_type:complete